MKQLLITDLDGTLACDSKVSSKSLSTLHQLGSQGVVRAIATGRSWFGAVKVLGEDFPIDYLLFSSGAGIVNWKTQELLHSHEMGSEAVRRILPEVQSHGWGFMLHDPIPGNHLCQVFPTATSCEDFHRRIERLGALIRPWENQPPEKATQFVVIVPDRHAETSVSFLRERLPEFSVIRATSPLDGVSAWIEIFPGGVSKARAAHWLSEHLRIPTARAFAIGNDFNDVDLLEWARTSVVVGPGLPHLGSRYPVVPPCHEEGFALAVERWCMPDTRESKGSPGKSPRG